MTDLNPVQDILIMTTGGTIDKSYDEGDGSLLNRQSEIQQWVAHNLRLPYKRISVVSIMSKDSLHMTDYDRSIFAKALVEHLKKKCPIVVLHGTDTMAKTANFCLQSIGQPEVPVIFTGAMRPKGFMDTDANQNVAEALFATGLVDPGFYISFHNRIYKVPNAQKNYALRTFERI